MLSWRERCRGGGGGTGKGAAFDSLPPTTRLPAEPALLNLTCNFDSNPEGGGGGGTLGISGWGCVAGTLEPLTYIRASSAEFCYPILE